MNAETSADQLGFLGRDRVCETVQLMLRTAQARGWTDERIGQAANLKPRYVKTLRTECKVPNMAAALCIAAVLGEWAMNMLLALVAYQGQPLDAADQLQPGAIVAGVAGPLGILALAAADGRFDHVEMPSVQNAADTIIATVLPLSSAGKGQH